MILIDDAELLSFQQTLSTLGNVLSYRKEKSYSVNGRLSNFTNFSGVSGIQALTLSQISGLQDHQEIVINGQSFGSGFITDINYEQGTDVREKKYSISFSVLENIDLFNVYGEYYSGVSGIQAYDLKFVESISESFDFEKRNDGTFSYSRNLNLSLESGVGTNPTQTAKNLADLLFTTGLNVSDLNAFYPNYYSSGNRVYNESYNLYDCEYSFSERFLFQSGDPFVWTFSHSINKNGNATVVNERGNILAATRPKETSSLIGYGGAIVGTYERCSGVLSQYNFSDGVGCPLINSPINQTVSYNQFNGAIDYDISYSNDSSISTGCITRISHRLSNPVDGNLTVNESVEIQGLGKNTYPENQKYLNAKNCYQQMLLNSGVRISGVMSGVQNVCCSGLTPVRLNISDSKSDGRISYSREYSCDSNLRVPDPFTRIASDVTLQEGVPLHQTFKIIGYGEEVIGGCKSGNVSLSRVSTNVEISSTGTLDMSVLLSGAYPYIVQPATGLGAHISDASYSYSSADRRFSLSVEYNYVKFKSLFDRTIG